jgi:putative redox protein
MSLNQVPLASATAHIPQAHYRTTITSAGHTLLADEPESVQGTNTGMSPHSLLLASLGSCTAITLRMYADRKLWPVEEINVALELYKSPTGTLIARKISFKGNITDEQHQRLLQIANSCPIHKILTGNVEVVTS